MKNTFFAAKTTESKNRHILAETREFDFPPAAGITSDRGDIRDVSWTRSGEDQNQKCRGPRPPRRSRTKTRGVMQFDQEQLNAKLAELALEHRDLDDVIDTLMNQSDFDQIKVGRLKKRRLALKDQITSLRGRLIPDIIA